MMHLDFSNHLNDGIKLLRKQISKKNKTDYTIKMLNFDYKWYIEIQPLKEYQIKLKPSKSQKDYVINMDLVLLSHEIHHKPIPDPIKKSNNIAKIIALIFIIAACIVLVSISVTIVMKLRNKKQTPLLEEGEQSLQNV